MANFRICYLYLNRTVTIKITSIYYLTIFVRMEFKSSLVGSDVVSSLMLQSKCHLGLQSLKGLSGLEGSLLIWLTHIAFSRRPQFLTLFLCTEQLEYPHNMADGFPQSKWYKRGKQKPQCLLWPSLRCHMLSLLQRVEKREPSYTVSGNVNWYNHYGKQYGGSLKN